MTKIERGQLWSDFALFHRSDSGGAAVGDFYEPDQALYSPTEVPAVETTRDVALLFAHEIPEYFKEVAVH